LVNGNNRRLVVITCNTKIRIAYSIDVYNNDNDLDAYQSRE